MAPVLPVKAVRIPVVEVRDADAAITEVRLRLNELRDGAQEVVTDHEDRLEALEAGGGGGGYDTVEDEGTPLAQQSTINFVGAGVTAADSGGKTVVTIPGVSLPVTIANGGTGQTTQTAAMDALSPTTTKGDLLVDNGTNVIRLAVGTNTHVLTANSAAAAGVEWAAAPGGGGGLDHAAVMRRVDLG